MTALADLLAGFRTAAVSEREKGTYFEELILAYFRHEASYKDLYSDVWTFADWAKAHGKGGKDTGIDLVAKTRATDEFHAIQCKFYAPDYRIQKADIDSFFTASGQKPFTHRLIVSTTDHWSDNAEAALRDQHIPVSRITQYDLESSQIDWGKFKPKAKAAPALRSKKAPFAHQRSAIDDVLAGLKHADRGKLLMACGTGKTFTALKIAERKAGEGRRVLFLVPSLALLSQSLTEWTQESEIELHSFAVCSDSDVGKKKSADDDTIQTFTHELRFPATTDAKRLAEELKARHDAKHMSVVFSTYHSIDVVHRAQAEFGVPAFDLIICDEAHRTTGATWDGEDESAFVKVHDAEYIKGRKRLYMTATPRIYGNAAKATADKENVTLASMDNVRLFGEELHRLSFSDAVQRGLLVDYKVIVLAIEEEHVNKRLQQLLADPNNQLKVDDASKIVGCWKALAKQGLREHGNTSDPMRRAVAFCQVIEPTSGARKHKVSSKNIAKMFQAVVEAYQESAAPGEQAVTLRCEADHVDGGMNASEKEAKLAWLKAPTPDDTCRILSNVRCLSEGVDVPALDAVLFLTPRNSQVDVVQSVGRVMRKAPGKDLGYVVLPVVIPAGMTPNDALDNNEVYKVVWQVLQALRSHDDRFDAMVNKLDLMKVPPSKMEVIAITDRIQPKQQPKRVSEKARNAYSIGNKPRSTNDAPELAQTNLEFEIGDIERAIYAKLVQKVGNRHHWEDWANDIARIAQTHISRITQLVENPKHKKERAAFQAFATELRDDLNDSITDGEVIEMLAQHLITKPVFDAIFAGHGFADRNPISIAMQQVLDVLHEHHLEKETDTLQGFYASVKLRAEGIDTAAGRQKIVVELYDKFFRGAFPKLTERLGIVYTPVEVVDFIIHSVAHLLEKEFGQTLGSEGVHILDPFTGTGTFITRLMQSGLITREQLIKKYKTEIHANEIVLLAYYIAGVNIEAVYHDIVGGDYEPFPGILLTDTFQMYEKEDLLSELLVDNSARRVRQRKLDIRVIIGNPPYSVGQSSANDNNQNIGYPALDGRIATTYAARSTAVNKNFLYDSYIRSIRWASDRVGESGIVAFVTNAGFLDGKAHSGMRRCLAEEFSSLFVLHLRGNQRTQGEQSRREGGKIFGGGSRAGISVSLLVKNPKTSDHGRVLFHDIGEYLDRDQKLDRLRDFGDLAGIDDAGGWTDIVPDSHGDWLNQRKSGFGQFIAMGDKRSPLDAIFDIYSNGVKTNRDAWAYNASRSVLAESMSRTITFYNDEVLRYSETHQGARLREQELRDFVTSDSSKISWTRTQLEAVPKGKFAQFSDDSIRLSLYRPFTNAYLYFDRFFNDQVYQQSQLFPYPNSQNLAIQVRAKWDGVGFIALMITSIPATLPTQGDAQSFPLYRYETAEPNNGRVESPQLGFGTEKSESPDGRRFAITDAALAHFQAAYPTDPSITKESIFYYCYGVLHHPEYLEQYADNLSKELPRIPRVRSRDDFWRIHDIGKSLGDWHVGFDRFDHTLAPNVVVDTNGKKLTDAQYRVEKMRYGKKDGAKDLTTIYYNEFITVRNIPAHAHDYIIHGRSAIDWIVERQGVRTDKDSGIVNDSNDWAIETMQNPKYPLELLLRVIALSVETLRLVGELPKLDVMEG
jgi:predicted helicase